MTILEVYSFTYLGIVESKNTEHMRTLKLKATLARPSVGRGDISLIIIFYVPHILVRGIDPSIAWNSVQNQQ